MKAAEKLKYIDDDNAEEEQQGSIHNTILHNDYIARELAHAESYRD